MQDELKNLLQETATLEMQVRTIGVTMDKLYKRHGENSLIKELADTLMCMHKKEQIAKNHIEKLSDPTLRTLFTNRYIKGLTWEEASLASYVSYAHAHRLHKKGLEEISKLQ